MPTLIIGEGYIGEAEVGGDLPAAYTLTATAATFALTPTVTALRVDKRIGAVTQTFSLTLFDVGLKRANKLPAVQSSFSITPTTTVLTAARRITATQSTFSWTTISAAIRAARRLAAESPNITTLLVTGLRARAAGASVITLTWEPLADFAIDGRNANIAKGFTLPITSAAYAFTPTSTRLFKMPAALVATAPLVAPMSLTASPLTSSSIRLTWQASPSYRLIGNDVNLHAVRRFSAIAATFALTGNNIGFHTGHGLSASTASFTFTPNNISFHAVRAMLATQGAFVWTGNPVVLRYFRPSDRFLIVEQARFSFDPPLIVPPDFNATALSASAIRLSWGASPAVENTVQFRRSYAMPAIPASFVWTGFEPGITYFHVVLPYNVRVTALSSLVVSVKVYCEMVE